MAKTGLYPNLSQLVDQFRGIVVAIRDLPADDALRDVSAILAAAAKNEDLALRNLRGTFERSEATTGGEPEAPTAALGGEFGFGEGPLGSEETPLSPPGSLPRPLVGQRSSHAIPPCLMPLTPS